MSIDLEQDQLLTLPQACRMLPRKPSPATLWRWRKSGVVVNGKRIRLECIRVGGQWHTTRAAFSEFLRRQTDAALATSENRDEPSVGRSEAMERKLKEAGLSSSKPVIRSESPQR